MDRTLKKIDTTVLILCDCLSIIPSLFDKEVAEMAYVKRELTPEERDAFIRDNWWGVLCFSGDEAYAIPMGYQCQHGEVLVGFADTGRKAEYARRNPNVCLNICRPNDLSSEYQLTFPYISVNIEGELVHLDDTDGYDIPPLPPGFLIFRLQQNRVGTLRLDLGTE